MGDDDHHTRGRQPEGRRGQDDLGRLHRRRARRARAAGAARRPRPAGVPDVLPRHRPRGPRAVDPPRADQGPRPGRGRDRDRRRRRPAAGHHRAGPRRGRPADPDRSRARAQGRARRPRRDHDVRLGAARLPALARRAHRRRADRGRRRADPAAVRDAVPPRRRPAARHRPRRTPVHQPRARGVGRAADAVRRTHQPRAGRAGDDLRDLRPRGHRAADPQDHQVRRGAGRRPVDPGDQPQQQGRQGLPRGGRDAARRRAAAAASTREGAADEPPPSASAGPRYGRIAALRRSRRRSPLRGGPRRARRPRRPVSADAPADPAPGRRAYRQTPAARSTTTTPRPGVDAAAAAPAPAHAPPAHDQRRPHRRADAALPAGSSGTGRRIVFSQHLPAGLAGRRPTTRCAHLPGLGQRDRQPPARHLRGLLAVAPGHRASTTPGSCSTSCASPRARPAPRSASTASRRKNGAPLQTAAQLGTPQSHGCIRQWQPDAIALWNFAPVGTKVVVVA